MSLSATADAINAIIRLEVVFEAEVLSEGRVIDPMMDDAVRIDHASFTWDAAPIVVDEAMFKLKGKYAKALGGGQGAAASKAQTPKKKVRRLIPKSSKDKKVSLAEQAHVEISDQRSSLGEAKVTRGGVTDTPGLDENKDIDFDPIFKIKDISLGDSKGIPHGYCWPYRFGENEFVAGSHGG